MNRLKSLFLILCCGALSGPVDAVFPAVRQPMTAKWETDLTDRCRMEDGGSMTERLSRARRTRADDAGAVFSCTLEFDAPRKDAPHGLMLEFDNIDVVERIELDGQCLAPQATRAMFWPGAEGGVLLPEQEKYRLRFRVRNLVQLYPNAFGRLVLRPASLNEVLTLERQPGTLESVRLKNAGCRTEAGSLLVESFDYFGVRTGERRFPFSLKPGESKPFRPEADPSRWRAVLTLEQNGERSWEYRDYPRADRWFPHRPEALCISGGWERCSGGEGAVRGGVPRSGWRKAGAFPLILDPEREKSHFLWLRTRVSVPAEWRGKNLLLALPMVHYKADLFVNGKETGSLFLWDTPAKVDLSPHVSAGETFELALCVTDFTAALLPGTEIPGAGVYGAPSRTLAGAVGHFPSGGFPALKAPPELLAESPVRTDHAFIRTLTAGGTRLEVDAELRNNSAEARDVQLECEVRKEGRRVLRLPGLKRTLAAGELFRTTLKQAWDAPEFWTPETPVLYEMRFTLRDASGGVLDVRRERFGFRELGIKGRHFTLNGAPVRFCGFSQTTPKTMVWPFVPQPQTLYRYHFHENEYYMGGIGHCHIGDELGIFAKAENLSHNAHNGERFAYQDPLIWERLYREMLHVFRATCNMPSVAFWDIGNENNFSAPGEPEKMGMLFERLNRLDPTRPVTVSGAYVLPRGSGVRVLDTHGFCGISMDTFFLLHPEKRPARMKTKGRFSHIPAGEDASAWEPARSFSVATDLYPYRKTLLHYGGLPVFFSESMYMHAFTLPGLCGESIYTPPVSGSYSRLSSLLGRRFMLRFARKAGVAATLGHVVRSHGREISPAAGFSSGMKLRFRSGERLLLPYDVYNSTSHSDTLTVRLELRENGEPVAERTKQIAMGPYGTAAAEFDFGVRKAAGNDRRFDLLISVRSARGGAFADWEELCVYREEPVRLPENTRLSVFDPSGGIVRFLSGRGVPFTRLDSASAWHGGEGELLLAGPGSLLRNEETMKLASVLKKGGTVLVLDHDVLPDLTALSLEQLPYGSVAVYPRFRRESPLYGVLAPSDLRFWNTGDRDLLTVRRMIRMPSKGNFRIHADGAYEDGIKSAGAALLDVGVGKGIARYCQFNLSSSLETEPAAERLLVSLLNRPAVPFGEGKCAILADGGSSRILRGRCGIPEPAGSFGEIDWRKTSSLVCDGKSLAALDRRQLERLGKWLSGGGRLLLLGMDSGCTANLSALAGEAVSLAPFALDRARFTEPHFLTAGISSGDLFWNSGKAGTNRSIRKVDEQAGKKAESSDPAHFEIRCRTARPLMKPGYLSLIPCGKGFAAVSTLRVLESPAPEAERLLCSLLTNFGVPLSPGNGSGAFERDRDAREGWNYVPIRLDRFCNRGFRDDPGSPVRGWSAQGPGDDLSAFPVGAQVMRGVSFHVTDPRANGGKGLIALSGTKEVGVLPAEVREIPVGRKFERLVFLYGAAWGAPQFTIRVNYADRKNWIPGAPDPFAEITMRPRIEIDDWYQAETYLSGDTMPRAKLAWAGFSALSKRRNRHVGVFLYEWDNPHPEKTIDSIDVFSPGRNGSGQLFLIAVSGADRRKAVSLEKLLPEEKAPQILKRLEWSGYGAVIGKNGSIPLIYRTKDALPLFSAGRWIVQGRKDGNGVPRHLFLDGAPSVPVKTEFSGRGCRLTFRSRFLEASRTITFGDTSVIVEDEYLVCRSTPEGIAAGLIVPFQVRSGTFGALVNVNPLPVAWEDGTEGALSYNADYCWHRGYYGSRNRVAFTPFRGRPLKKGEVRRLRVRLNLP